jgi:ubiquinone/menaquinone biosynthesis C-methylase UbiE
MLDYDAVAAQFAGHRMLPAGVAAYIRDELWMALGAPAHARVLEVGAGTGRIGGAFVAAGDAYVGVDVSWERLRRFSAHAPAAGAPPQLVQADGADLPFAAATFDAVLLAQVLGAVRGWRQVLAEARRVLRPWGGLALGQTLPPADGIDVRMRAQLGKILNSMSLEVRPPGARYDEARASLAATAGQHIHLVAATWERPRTPREFLTRQATGTRFAALPLTIQEDALARLAAWATDTFGSLDTSFEERWAFDLDVFVF